METYFEFLNRINSFEKREMSLGGGAFKVSPSVALKVNGDNTFKSFYGDTTVFDLDGETKDLIRNQVDLLYCAAPECFCERLVPHTFHMTLHDLSNSQSLSDIAEETFINELKVAERRERIKRLASEKIRMKTNYVFNMVNTSLVLGLCPADEREYEKLMSLYSILDEVKKLSYPLTPHITLAYYNVNGFEAHAARALEKVVNELNGKPPTEIVLGDLHYQKFTGMNSYVDIIILSK